MSFIFAPRLWAFPSVFSYIDKEQNQKVMVSCIEGVSPVADISALREIADNLSCENMSAEDYCECIQLKLPGTQSDNEITVLKTELGFFGNGEDSFVDVYLKEVLELQKLQQMYGDKFGNKCFMKAEGEYGFKLEKNANEILNNLETDYETSKVAPYLNTTYIEKVLPMSKLLNFSSKPVTSESATSDARLMTELAKVIREEQRKKTEEGRQPHFKMDSQRPETHPTETAITTFFSNTNEDDYAGSTLYKALNRKFKYFPDKEFSFFSNNNSVLSDIIEATNQLNLGSAKSNDGSIDLDKISEQMQKGEVHSFLGHALDTLCDESSRMLLMNSATSDAQGQMSADKKKHFLDKGDALLQEFSSSDDDGPEVRKDKFRRLGVIQQQVTKRIMGQFKYPTDASLDPKTSEDIKSFVHNKKDAMGKMWCHDQKKSGAITYVTDILDGDKDKTKDYIDAQDEIKRLEAEHLEKITDIAKATQIKNNAINENAELTKRLNETKNQIKRITISLSSLDSSSPNYSKNVESFTNRIKVLDLKRSDLKKDIEQNTKVRDQAILRAGVLQKEADKLETKITSKKNSRVNDLVEGLHEVVVGDAGGKRVGGVSGAPDLTSLVSATDQITVTDITANTKDLDVFNVGDNPVSDKFFYQVDVLSIGDNIFVGLDPDSKDIYTATHLEISQKSAQTMRETVAILEEATANGLMDDTPEEVINNAVSVIEEMVNDSHTSLKSFNADEEILNESKEKTSKLNEVLESRLGEVNFQELGEYSKIISDDEIMDDFIEKKNKVAYQLTQNKLLPTKISTDEVRESITETNSKAKKVAEVVDVVEQPKESNPSHDVFSQLAEVLEKKDKPKKVEKSTFDPYKERQIAEAKRKKQEKAQTFEKEKNKIKKEIGDLSQEIKTIKKENIEKVQKTKKTEATKVENDIKEVAEKSTKTAPVDLPVSSPFSSSSNNSKKRKGNINNALNNFRSIGTASVSASPASSVASIIEKQVNGGVIVNGEFIPEILLYRGERRSSYKKTIDKENNIKASKYQGSTFDMIEVMKRKDEKSSLIPIVTLESFESLSENDRELFAQNQFIKFNTSEVLIKLKDGRQVLIKSKISLDGRKKVSELNDILDRHTTIVD